MPSLVESHPLWKASGRASPKNCFHKRQGETAPSGRAADSGLPLATPRVGLPAVRGEWEGDAKSKTSLGPGTGPANARLCLVIQQPHPRRCSLSSSGLGPGFSSADFLTQLLAFCLWEQGQGAILPCPWPLAPLCRHWRGRTEAGTVAREEEGKQSRGSCSRAALPSPPAGSGRARQKRETAQGRRSLRLPFPPTWDVPGDLT